MYIRALLIAVLVFPQAMPASAQDAAATPSSAPQKLEANDALTHARELLEAGDVAKALAELKQLEARNPAMAGLDRELGIAYYRSADYLRASTHLEKVATADPDDKEAVQLLGLAYFFIGKPKQAIPLLERVQGWYPKAHVDASYVLGICYLQSMDYDNARKAFATMYGVAPDSAASHLFLARMLLRQGFDPIAEQEAKKAISIDQHLPLAHYLLGEMYIFKSRIPEAIEQLEAELTINPADPTTYYRLADAYTRVLRWDDAEKLLQRSLWLDATASGPYILMGKVLLKKNDPTLAARSLDKALSMDPNNYIAHHLLGEAYRALGKATEAENELRLSEKLQAQQSRSRAEAQ